jgi:hypothetical protein
MCVPFASDADNRVGVGLGGNDEHELETQTFGTADGRSLLCGGDDRSGGGWGAVVC